MTTTKPFAENFTTLATSTDGIAKLRELILQLAVQGKLVPQNPNDEPASVLLEKIEKEKAKLIKEGKLREQKLLPPIKKDEVPYELSENWKCVRLGEITNIVYGKNMPVSNLIDKGYPVWGANGIIGCFSDYLYEDEQLLISCRGAYSGKINISPPNAFITNNSLILQMTTSLKPSLKYLYYTLTGLDKSKLVSGSAQPQVTTKNASPLVVPIPPLAEQKRIVAKVDQLMALCNTMEEQLAQSRSIHRQLNDSAIHHLLTAKSVTEFEKTWKLICDNFDLLYDCSENVDKLRQAILQMAVQGKLVPQNPKDEPADKLLEKIQAEKQKLIKAGKLKKQKPLPPIAEDEIPRLLPNGWQWTRLGDISTFLGGAAFKSDSYVKESNNQIIRLGNVKNDALLLTQKPAYIPNKIAESHKNVQLCQDDMLITMTGTRGKRDYCFTAMVHSSHLSGKNLFLNQRVGCLRACNQLFKPVINMFLKSNILIDMLLGSETGTANQGNVGAGAIRNLPFPLPPLAEQKRIVAKVDKLMALCDQLQERIAAARTQSEQLTASTIHHLLAG